MPKPSKFASVSIPTKTYLKKYLHYKLGENIFAAGSHHIQKFLTILLEKRVYNYNFTALNTQYQDKLTIFVSLNTFKNVGFGMNPAHVIDFNNYVEELFDDDLYNFCKLYLSTYKVAGSAITRFATENNINLSCRQRRTFTKEPHLEDARHEFAKQIGLEVGDDISFEALKKMEYRARKKRENIFLQPVPELSQAGLMLLFK